MLYYSFANKKKEYWVVFNIKTKAFYMGFLYVKQPFFTKKWRGIIMGHLTKNEIMKMVKENDVKFIRLQFTDIFGTLKNVAITESQLEKALDNQCMFDGSSIEGFVRIEESDMYLRPDMDTFVIFPWRPQQNKVARLICDVYNTDGTPFAGDPRNILKKILKEAR